MKAESAKRMGAARRLSYISYGLLGRRVERLYPLFKELRAALEKAGSTIGFRAYVSLMCFASILSLVITFALLSATFTLIYYPFRATILYIFTLLLTSYSSSIVLSFVASLAAAAVTFLALYFYPSYKTNVRKERMEHFLPHTASFMTVLACAGVPPERILRSTATKDPIFLLSDEARSIVGKIDLFGYDTLTALDSEIDRSPSTSYSNMLRGFAATVRTGGDLKKFFLNSTRQLMNEKSLRVQRFLDTLGMLAESYVIMLIAFPLMLVLMFSIMAAVGSTIGGIDVFQLMYFITFGMIPICGILFLFLLDAIQPKA